MHPVTSHEQNMISELLRSSCAVSTCEQFKNARIHSVQRIENQQIYQCYSNKTTEIMKQLKRLAPEPPELQPPVPPSVRLNKEGFANAVYLWHGTKQRTVATICKQGFDDRAASLSSNLYGAGIYFAEQSCKSLQYANPDAGGVQWLFLARVCLGNPAYPVARIMDHVRLPPCLRCCGHCCVGEHCDDQQRAPADSVIANPGVAKYGLQIHREFIVYDRSQTYPKNLVGVKL